MKSIIKTLLFDKEIINNLTEKKVAKEHLYNQLTNGKITLQEYLFATR